VEKKIVFRVLLFDLGLTAWLKNSADGEAFSKDAQLRIAHVWELMFHMKIASGITFLGPLGPKNSRRKGPQGSHPSTSCTLAASFGEQLRRMCEVVRRHQFPLWAKRPEMFFISSPARRFMGYTSGVRCTLRNLSDRGEAKGRTDGSPLP
jgi:hypothetical protein